jgi:hypothetical protein
LYLGSHPATFKWKGDTYDQKLKPGETQRFQFTEEDPPPFYDLEAPKYDTPTNKTNRKGQQRTHLTAAWTTHLALHTCSSSCSTIVQLFTM